MSELILYTKVKEINIKVFSNYLEFYKVMLIFDRNQLRTLKDSICFS